MEDRKISLRCFRFVQSSPGTEVSKPACWLTNVILITTSETVSRNKPMIRILGQLMDILRKYLNQQNPFDVLGPHQVAGFDWLRSTSFVVPRKKGKLFIYAF